MREKTKDVTINGINFRIGLVSALVGDWIINQTMAKNTTDEKVYSRIQSHLLGACSLLCGTPDGDQMPMKVFAEGRWLVLKQCPELEYDSDLLHDLLNEVEAFNFGPFLQKFASRLEAERLAKIQAITQSSSPTI